MFDNISPINAIAESTASKPRSQSIGKKFRIELESELKSENCSTS
ncbi:MAG: hypothetical protein V7L20_18205 [Nostoc sp.]